MYETTVVKKAFDQVEKRTNPIPYLFRKELSGEDNKHNRYYLH